MFIYYPPIPDDIDFQKRGIQAYTLPLAQGVQKNKCLLGTPSQRQQPPAARTTKCM